MSGIVGFIRFDQQPVDRAMFARMLDAIAAYGPDGIDYWYSEEAALGFASLWNTPESVFERQPIVWDSQVLTADARIDNREALLCLLKFDKPHAEITDSELIFAAYRHWGEQCVDHLFGDFAFAIWDREHKTVFCARDHYAIKPFFYHYQPGRWFLFASDEWALLECLPIEVNERFIARWLTSAGGSLRYEERLMPYRHIENMRPTSTLAVSASHMRERVYWEPDDGREIRFAKEETYFEQFRALFSESVRARLRSIYPVSADLSGGLDSSSVTTVARALLKPQNLHVFHSRPDDPENDETEYVQAVLDGGNLIYHQIRYGDPLYSLKDDGDAPLEKKFSYEQNRAPMIAHMKENHIRTLLTGYDGDSIVSHGDGYLTELAYSRNWVQFGREIEAYKLRHELSQRDFFATVLEYASPYLESLIGEKRLLHYLADVRALSKAVHLAPWAVVRSRGRFWLPRPMQKMIGKWRGEYRTELRWEQMNPFIQPAFAEAENAQSFMPPPDQHRTLKTLREMHKQRVLPAVFEPGSDGLAKFTAQAHVEVRHPFLDVRLVEYCLALPPEFKLHDGFGRYIMRKSLAGLLPPIIQWRATKADFGTAFFNQLLAPENIKLLDDIILSDLSDFEAYIAVEKLRALYHDTIRRRAVSGGASRRAARNIWLAVTLIVWMRAVKRRAAAQTAVLAV